MRAEAQEPLLQPAPVAPPLTAPLGDVSDIRPGASLRAPAFEHWVVIAMLALLVVLNAWMLGSDSWNFRPSSFEANGVLGWIAELADLRWDTGLLRGGAMLAGVLVLVAAALLLARRSLPRFALIGLAVAVVATILVPAVLLQVSLRDSSAPWFFTNDSSYQTEIAGDLLLEGENPYGYDYTNTELERFYSLDGSIAAKAQREVQLQHFPYFPGTTLAGAVWAALPAPWDDFRLFVVLVSLAGFAVGLAFPGPLPWRVALGAFIAANPLAVFGAWFGTSQAPALVLVALAFALLARRYFAWAAAALAVAVLMRQFALVAAPFVALAMLHFGGGPRLKRAGAVFGAIVLAGVAPFLLWDAGAFWGDTIEYGGETYPVIGHGLAGLLVQLGIVERRGAYPFAALALLVWLPATLWLLWQQSKSRTLWAAAAGFSISIFALLYVGRVFQSIYLVWPLTGLALAAYLGAYESMQKSAPVSEPQEQPSASSLAA
jgi:hypothetical protein